MNQQQGNTKPQSKRGEKNTKKKPWLWGAEFRQRWNLVRGEG